MNVKIEKREIDITEDMDLQLIIDQDLKPGTEIIISEDNPSTIILYIPDAYAVYPDFVGEGWTIDMIQEFAEKYELVLDIKYTESDEYPVGTVIKQSRTGKIVNGASLTITVTKEVTPKPVEEPEDDDSQENNSGEETQ